MVQVDSRWTLENHLESSGVHLNSVRECKVLNSLCSSITESHHITAVKKPWCHFNCYEALGKMLITNQWLDKLTAARNNFIVCGMLPLELCLLDFYAHFWIINLVEAMAPSWTWICQMRMMIFWNTYFSDTILQGAPLIPVFGKDFLPSKFRHNWSLDLFKAFFVNKLCRSSC